MTVAFDFHRDDDDLETLLIDNEEGVWKRWWTAITLVSTEMLIAIRFHGKNEKF